MVHKGFPWSYRGLFPINQDRQYTIEDQAFIRQRKGHSADGNRIARQGGPLSLLTIKTMHDYSKQIYKSYAKINL